MSSIWIGKTGLRLKYSKLSHLELSGANSPTNAVLLTTLMGASRIGYFSNSLNAEIAILACHPENDPAIVGNRLLLFEMDPGQIINFESNLSSLSFDAGTYLYVHYIGSIAPTSGKIKLVWWG